VTLQVELAVPEGGLWAGPAGLVIAKTLDGDIGVLTGHSPVLGILAGGSPVLGILAGGSVVRIRAENAEGAASGSEEPADLRYFRALLRAAGDPADGA
jgi:hypothetical protein